MKIILFNSKENILKKQGNKKFPKEEGNTVI